MNATVRAARHEELADFLIARRTRLSPESCGLPSFRPRRRTPGLRREDVSAIAGISTAYYTWIEQGRTFEISVEVLEALAHALRLTETETAHLFTLAGKADPSPARPRLGAWSDAIGQLIGLHEETPALALTAWLEVLAANAPARELFGLERGDNLADWVFSTRREPIRCLNRERIADAIVALLHRNRARDMENERFDEVIDRLRRGSQVFDACWACHAVDAPPLYDVEIEHERLGRRTYRTVLLCDPVAASQFVLFMTPLSDAISSP
jgi:transcriptional regulator with XRE-family HTH domain